MGLAQLAKARSPTLFYASRPLAMMKIAINEIPTPYLPYPSRPLAMMKIAIDEIPTPAGVCSERKREG